MSGKITTDIEDMERKLKLYVDKGRIAENAEAKQEPVIAVKPDASKFKPLKKIENCEARFLAVDCSTRTLKRANNWGIYLMRPAYVEVKERKVEWGFRERMSTVVGDSRVRRDFLHDLRIELESHMALELLTAGIFSPGYAHGDVRGTYLLLDGGGYFGGESKFRVSLYEKCEKDDVRLLAISKNSPSLHDEKGRDFIAATHMLSPPGTWVYHPIKEADKNQSLYGDISIIKLCEENPRVFRCDVMEYLTRQGVSEVLSPLTAIAEDPRCLGYPISLWLAHEFSAPSDSMLLSYHDQIEERLSKAGLLETLRSEELTCNFADELHGIKYAFQWEWWDGQI